MRTVICRDCGKRYDYDQDDFCPKCGSYNPPEEKPATRMEEEMLARFRTGQQNQSRAVRPQAKAKSPQPGPRSVNYHPTYGGTPEVRASKHAGRFQDCSACEEPVRRSPALGVVLTVVVLIVVGAAAVGIIGAFNAASDLGTTLFGTALFTATPETAAPSYPPPRSGEYALGEAFTINATQVTVDAPWQVDVSAAPSIAPEGARCVAVDIWVEGGVRRDDLSFPPVYLELEDGGIVYAVDGDALLSRKLKSCGVFDVSLSDAQWEDPLFGQLVFLVPEDCGGTASLVLPEAASGAAEDEAPAACHTVAVTLP